MQSVLKVIQFINDNILWGIPLIIALLGTGVILTVRSRAVQVRKLGDAFKSTVVPTVKSIGKKSDKKDKTEKSVSPFEAFSAAISGTVGTGNIVGVASAIISGGFGAVFWMWVSAFFGLCTNFSENVLGLYFRKKDKDGVIYGGPMYYIEHGISKKHSFKWLAMIFAACCMLAASGMGMVQANNISGTLQTTINSAKSESTDLIIGICVAALVVIFTALVVLGGIQRIGKVTSMIVPFMCVLFVIMALIIIFMNIAVVPAAFALIFKEAFSFRSLGGGLLGYGIMMAMRYGFARGIFSNEAGLGSSVIAQCSSEEKEPVKQGLWGIFGVFIDTFVICTLTALTIITTVLSSGKEVNGFSGNTSSLAIFPYTEMLGIFGNIVFSIILPLFAFTTIVAWAHYGEKAAQYIFGQKHAKISGTVFKVVYIGTLVFGALVKNDFIWALDDMFNALMALPNLIALICMSGLVCKITKNYYDRKKGLDIEPMLSAYPEVNKELSGKK